MPTYTPNYNLYLPALGDGALNGKPWGARINGNFSTIDTALHTLDESITGLQDVVPPAFSSSNNGQFLGVIGGALTWATVQDLPAYSSANNGQVLGVAGGAPGWVTVQQVPSFSGANNGQVLGVVGGALAWVAQTGSGGSLPDAPAMEHGKLLGATWTADNVGSLAVAQDGNYLSMTVTDSGTTLRGYTIPMPTLPCRIVAKIGCDTTNTYTCCGIGFKSSGGAVKCYYPQAWSPYSFEVASWASTSSYTSTIKGGGGGSFTSIWTVAVDIDASGNVKCWLWRDNTWVLFDSTALGFVPSYLGIYLKGQSSSAATGHIYWMERRAYGDKSAPYFGG